MGNMEVERSLEALVEVYIERIMANAPPEKVKALAKQRVRDNFGNMSREQIYRVIHTYAPDLVEDDAPTVTVSGGSESA